MTNVFIFQAQINVMGNRQNGSNSSHVPVHADNDNSASAHSTSVAPQSAAAAAASPAPSAPPDSGASAPQTETATSNTDQTRDSPQTPAGRPQGTAQGELHSTAGLYMYSTHYLRWWNGI